MQIAIIGAARVCATLGRRIAGAGHNVVHSVRDPADPLSRQPPRDNLECRY